MGIDGIKEGDAFLQGGFGLLPKIAPHGKIGRKQERDDQTGGYLHRIIRYIVTSCVKDNKVILKLHPNIRRNGKRRAISHLI
jgi:hypothetical protein